MIVHFLQIAGGHASVGASGTIILLGTLDDHFDVVVRIGSVAGAFDDITLTELALVPSVVVTSRLLDATKMRCLGSSAGGNSSPLEAAC